MSIYLDEKEKRALKIISQKTAHEVDTHPIKIVSELFKFGLVKYSPFETVFARGRKWYQREISITDAGLNFLNKAK